MARVLVACLALAGLFILLIFAVRKPSSQEVIQKKLSVESGRPVAEAILRLEGKYGWVITYEDPRYVHDSEIADVTLEVRRDLEKYKPGEAPKVLVPRGGSLEFTYDVVPGTNLPLDPAKVVQRLLDAQALRSNGGRFRLESKSKIMHVIPTAMKNSDGTLVPQGSVLDTIISLPAVDRTIYEKMESICAAITRAGNMQVELGTIPTNLFLQHQDHQGVVSQTAREVLVDTFEKMDYGTNLSWRLLYGPGTKKYILNIHIVSKHSD